MSKRKSEKRGITLKQLNIALGASLDTSNIELEKMTKGPVNYAVSHTEFSLPIKEVKIDRKREVTIVFPKTPEEMAKAQYVKIDIKAVPKVVTPKKPVTQLKVEDIEGIDPKIVEKLRKININNISDLAESSVKNLVAKAKIEEKKAREYLGMAKFIMKSSFAGIEGLDEEIAEVLIRGAKINSIDKLASANSENLYKKLKDAIEKKVVRIPKTYELTLDDVKRWVLSAKRHIRA